MTFRLGVRLRCGKPGIGPWLSLTSDLNNGALATLLDVWRYRVSVRIGCSDVGLLDMLR